MPYKAVTLKGRYGFGHLTNAVLMMVYYGVNMGFWGFLGIFLSSAENSFGVKASTRTYASYKPQLGINFESLHEV